MFTVFMCNPDYSNKELIGRYKTFLGAKRVANKWRKTFPNLLVEIIEGYGA